MAVIAEPANEDNQATDLTAHPSEAQAPAPDKMNFSDLRVQPRRPGHNEDSLPHRSSDFGSVQARLGLVFHGPMLARPVTGCQASAPGPARWEEDGPIGAYFIQPDTVFVPRLSRLVWPENGHRPRLGPSPQPVGQLDPARWEFAGPLWARPGPDRPFCAVRTYALPLMWRNPVKEEEDQRADDNEDDLAEVTRPFRWRDRSPGMVMRLERMPADWCVRALHWWCLCGGVMKRSFTIDKRCHGQIREDTPMTTKPISPRPGDPPQLDRLRQQRGLSPSDGGVRRPVHARVRVAAVGPSVRVTAEKSSLAPV
nr:unnamed protein product [Digitaria exilis]